MHPCIGCDTCRCGKKPGVFQDSMNCLYPELKKADMVVFVSPLYYHGLSAQIKTAIDRFHGIDDDLVGTDKKAMLLMTAASTILLRMDWFIKAISTAMKRMQKAAQDLLL
ncbi:flavodoxin family protein [Collinsella aerofaciens]|uniref:flavodoxin family protein n=1 Tax=Collinsella aerofaciens TaxID=74426 RepID=UPI00321A1D97